MTDIELANLITVFRRAPLANMDEAEAAAKLLQKLLQLLRPEKESANGSV